MSEILKFCGENWKYLVVAASTILEIILILVSITKGRKDVFKQLLEVLPDYIYEAEKAFAQGNGKEKLTYVVQKSLDFLVSLTNWNKSRVVRVYTNAIIAAVENILKTPEKKGV